MIMTDGRAKCEADARFADHNKATKVNKSGETLAASTGPHQVQVKLASAARNDPISPETRMEMFDKIMRDATNNYGTEGSATSITAKVHRPTTLPLQAYSASAEALIPHSIALESGHTLPAQVPHTAQLCDSEDDDDESDVDMDSEDELYDFNDEEADEEDDEFPWLEKIYAQVRHAVVNGSKGVQVGWCDAKLIRRARMRGATSKKTWKSQVQRHQIWLSLCSIVTDGSKMGTKCTQPRKALGSGKMSSIRGHFVIRLCLG